MTLATTLALLLSMNAAETAEIGRELANGQKQWTFEYDIAITPYVEDYKRCLNYANRIARGVPDFEAQHRADIPRCEEERATAVAASKEVLERRELTDLMSFADVDRTFDIIGRIHVERGRHIDSQFAERLSAYRAAAATVSATPPSEETNAQNQ